MTSDPSLLLQRIRRLSQALLISGALNIGVLSLLLFWVLRERPPTPYCELKPASYEQQQIPLADQRRCTEVIAQLSQLSYPQLVTLLSNTQMIEDGYAERDLALACLTAFHHFDIQRALPKNAQPLQKRFFAWKPKAQEPSIPLVIYPDLKQHHFDALIQFAKTERWPFTSEGLFLLLQEQRKKHELNDNLMESFVLTPEFWTVELLFNRSGQQLSKQEILTVLLEGNWPLLKQFVEQQRQLQDSSDARRQKFLLDYLKAGSPSAALLLLKTEWEFAVRKLDDQQAIAILELMGHKMPENERFAIEMLTSPRSTNVWKKAAEWLYVKAGEPVPAAWDYEIALARFAPDKSQADASSKPAAEISPAPPLQAPAPQTPTPSSAQKPVVPKKLPEAPVTSSKQAVPPKVKKDKEPVEKKEASEKKPVKVPPPSPPKQRTYTVQEGDSLWKIARRFGVKIEEIRTINNLQSDTLKPGTNLKIPSSKEKKS